jgi:bifunctional DNA-binding transcriptional regulator/antitoxin component of YhaV-PrlF toxin-antitoxin module
MGCPDPGAINLPLESLLLCPRVPSARVRCVLFYTTCTCSYSFLWYTDLKMNSHISRGGQVSIPAAVRRRWGTDQIVLEDQGDAVVIRPIPTDPFRAARGSIRLRPGLTSEILRKMAREEDEEIERRRDAEWLKRRERL